MIKNNAIRFTLVLVIAFVMLSRTAFCQSSSKLDAAIRTESIEKLSKLLVEKYVFPETGKKMATQLAINLKNGKYDKVEEFGQFSSDLTSDLYEIAKDKHLRIYYSPTQVEELRKYNALSDAEKEEYSKKEVARESKTNFGFEKVEILNGNIGYLKLSRFALVNAESSETAFAAMKFIANTDFVIFDLRGNGGGAETMAQLLASFFYEYSEFENMVLWEDHLISKDEVIPYRVLPYIPGERMVKTPLYILVNQFSLSAAEGFAYSLQKLGRATIVGEQTNFGVNGCGGADIINDYYTITIPVGTMISPVTKTSCEGIGVIPDIKTASGNALDSTLTVIYLKQDSEKPQVENVAPDNSLKQYAGVYEFNPTTTATISVKGIQVFAEITGRPGDFEIFPMGKDKYNVPGMGIEVTFIIENGIVTGLNFSRGGRDNYAKKITKV